MYLKREKMIPVLYMEKQVKSNILRINSVLFQNMIHIFLKCPGRGACEIFCDFVIPKWRYTLFRMLPGVSLLYFQSLITARK